MRGRYHSKSHLHVWQREIHLLGALLSYSEIREYDVNLAGLKKLHAACRLNRYKLQLNVQNGNYRTVDEIKSEGKISIGVFSDKMPFGYVDNEGEYQGYDVYFARRIAQDLNVELELVPVEAIFRAAAFSAKRKTSLSSPRKLRSVSLCSAFTADCGKFMRGRSVYFHFQRI